jgi:hypothetical protein
LTGSGEVVEGALGRQWKDIVVKLELKEALQAVAADDGKAYG